LAEVDRIQSRCRREISESQFSVFDGWSHDSAFGPDREGRGDYHTYHQFEFCGMDVWQTSLESDDVDMIGFHRKMCARCSKCNNSFPASREAVTIVFANPMVTSGQTNEADFLIRPSLVLIFPLFLHAHWWPSPSLHHPWVPAPAPTSHANRTLVVLSLPRRRLPLSLPDEDIVCSFPARD
jgi:hypothetical protein